MFFIQHWYFGLAPQAWLNEGISSIACDITIIHITLKKTHLVLFPASFSATCALNPTVNKQLINDKIWVSYEHILGYNEFNSLPVLSFCDTFLEFVEVARSKTVSGFHYTPLLAVWLASIVARQSPSTGTRQIKQYSEEHDIIKIIQIYRVEKTCRKHHTLTQCWDNVDPPSTQ